MEDINTPLFSPVYQEEAQGLLASASRENFKSAHLSVGITQY